MKVNRNTPFAPLAVLLLAGMVATSPAQAQTQYFDTYTTRELIKAEGTFKLPFGVHKPDAKQFDDYMRVTKPYVDYMNRLANDYLGYERRCSTDALIFLPGSTESAFRASEKALNNTLTTTGYKRSTGESGRYLTLKIIPTKTLDSNLTGSFYIYKPSVYPRSSASTKTHYVYGYFFNKKLKQGSLISCSFFPKS